MAILVAIGMAGGLISVFVTLSQKSVLTDVVARLAVLEATTISLDDQRRMYDRVGRIEAMLDLWFSKMTKIMHSPHTPEIDSYLERIVAKNMTDMDWVEFMKLCNSIEQDSARPTQERALAAMASIMCHDHLGILTKQTHQHSLPKTN